MRNTKQLCLQADKPKANRDQYALVTRYSPSRTVRPSSTLRLNPVNFNLKSYGSRAFAVSAPDLWNSLPDNIPSCHNLST